MGSWESFFATEATAAAAVMGLIFVGVSINLQRIIQIAKLADRAILLLVVLVSKELKEQGASKWQNLFQDYN